MGVNWWRRMEGVIADKYIKKTEREGSDVVCHAGLPLRPGDSGTDRVNNRGCRIVRTTGSRGLQG